MRAWILAVGLCLGATAAAAQGEHYVNGYTRSDGTYVQPHMQTNPNGTTADNWSTRGNVNPYTGQPGTKPAEPYQSYRAPSYGSPPAPMAPTYGSSYGQTPQGSSYGMPPAPSPNPY